MTTNKLTPWIDEPDELAWVDKPTGLACLILRQGMGHLCGYVQSDLSEDDSPFYVHGGITFSGRIEQQTGLWIGFDCAHSNDLVPEMFRKSREKQGVYRTINYVKREVKSLALQVSNYQKKMASK